MRNETTSSRLACILVSWHQVGTKWGLLDQDQFHIISLIRVKRLFPSAICMKSDTRTMISRVRSSMSSADGASLSISRPRFLLMNIGCPFLVCQIECKSSFLRSATSSTLLRIATNSLQAASLAKNNFALSRSFFTSCFVGKSFVRIAQTSLFKPQILQPNSSTNECSRENRMLNFPMLAHTVRQV